MSEHLFGVGGNWNVIDEIISPDVIKQFDPLACGVTCGVMLLRDRGITNITPESLATRTGIPVEADQLAAGLNQMGGLPGTWKGQHVFIPGGSDDQLIEALNTSGTWAAGANLGHMIIVDGYDRQGCLQIRDPYGRSNSEFGSQYKIEVEEFLRYWSFQAVYYLAS